MTARCVNDRAMDRQQDVIRRITAHVVAYRFQLENERRNMSRLTDKLVAAAAVAPRQAARLEARADRILAREPEIERRADDVFAPHELILYEAEMGMDSLDASLRLMSNNPPLEHSTPLPAATGATTDRVALGPHPDQPEAEQTASQQPGSASAPADPRPNGADVLVRAAQ